MDLEISEVFESRRRNICIRVNNFKFTKYRVLKSGDFYFRCTNKKCNGLYVVNKLYNKVIRVINDHSKHSEYSENEIEKEMIRSVVKRKGETQLHIQPSKIIRQTLHLNQGNNLKHSDIHLLRNSMYAARKKQLPTLPKNVNEEINQIREMQENLLFKGKQFIYLPK